MKRLLWLVILILLVVRWHNAQVYPYTRGFDHSGHSRYLRQVALEGFLPNSQEGWSGYHPPLYYITSSAVAHALGWTDPEGLPRAAQLVSALASILAVLLAYPAARRLVPGYEEYVVLFLAALPAEIMLAAMVYNVTFGYLFANLFLCLAIDAWREPRPVVWREILLGVVAGLAMLSRPDGSVLPLILTALWIGRMVRVPEQWKEYTLSYAVGGFLVCGMVGWFFLRNLQLYGRPFVFACDADIFPYYYTNMLITMPGFRTLWFYAGPDLGWWLEPGFPGAFTSFLGVTFASSWWDYFYNFYQTTPVGLARLFLVAGMLLTLVALRGLWRRLDQGAWWMVTASIGLTWAFYLAMTASLPLDTAVKSTYIYTSFLATALCFGAGVSELSPRAAQVVAGGLAVFGLLTAWAFWWPVAA